MEIVLVEDEANLRAALRYAFEREGWTTVDFADGENAWRYLAGVAGAAGDGSERVVVADITMPRMDGLELCRRLRGIDTTLPWLFLSSRDEEFDRILGLEIGADDYLCKPFSVRELVARIRVLHRRAWRTTAGRRGASGGQALVVDGPVSLGLVLDTEAWRAWWQGRELVLTVSEFRILASLAAVPGVVKTRSQLQQAAFPEDQYVNERSVDCHIKRLRRKLAGSGGPAGRHEQERHADAEGPIATVYGLGYRFQP